MNLQSLDLDSFLKRDRHAMRVYLAFAVLVFVLGLLLLLASFIPKLGLSQGFHGLALKLGGGFLSSLSTFPLKEYLARRDRIHGVVMIMTVRQQLLASTASTTDELKRIEEIIWKIYEKGAVG